MPSWKDFLQFDYLSDGLKQVCQVMSSSYKKAEPREFHVRRKAMSKFQGTQNKIFWRYHHSQTITWLSSFLVELLKLNEGPILKTAHLNRSTCFLLDLHGCFPNPATITTLELTSGQPRKLKKRFCRLRSLWKTDQKPSIFWSSEGANGSILRLKVGGFRFRWATPRWPCRRKMRQIQRWPF